MVVVEVDGKKEVVVDEEDLDLVVETCLEKEVLN